MEGKAPQVRVRFPPSPTGPFHVGSARTALFNWLFARKHGGVLVLRTEDTDKARSEKKYEDDILAGLTWLGLGWDEGPYRQSERTAIYKKYLEALIAKGDAYYCYCTKEELEAQRDAMASQGLVPKYSGRCRHLTAPPEGQSSQVIRFKVPAITVEFKDLVRGKVSFDAGLFGDIAIARTLEDALYNFAVVVDDELMEITHVIRGEDHLSNTPKQIVIQRALGFREPIYAHIPLILNPDRSKMSKRFADTAVSDYRARGYLPDAMVNFLALLGWHPKEDREVLSREELIREFDLERVQSSGAVFNEEKLNWLNREYIKHMPNEEIVKLIREADSNAPVDSEFLRKVVAIERGRANAIGDFMELGRFFIKLPEYEAPLLVWKDSNKEEALRAFEQLKAAFMKISAEAFQRETIAAAVTYTIEGGLKRGAVLWPLRVALSGLPASPDPVDIAEVLGREESLRRMEIAIKKLAS